MSDQVAKPTTLTYEGVMEAPSLPTCPVGWRTGPPDFVGIGAQRSGTTRWFDLIVSHPQIAAPPATRKELHYFDRFHAGGFSREDAATYQEYFPRPEGKITGEWTPVYLAGPWIPGLLAAAAPDAKLLVLLRDPVERYLSGMQRHYRVARATEKPLGAFAPLEAFMRGFYHSQLTHLLAHFARSQVLILQYERCTREPLTELRRTYEFLGLGDMGPNPDFEAHPNLQHEKPSLHADARQALIGAYTDDVKRLADGFPEIDLGLWPNFAHLAGVC